MTTDDHAAPMLPGLEPPAAAASPLEIAVRRTLAALASDGLVREVDAGKLQLAIELAQLIAMKKTTKRASTVGNDARVLMEILNDFKEEVGGVDADLAAVMGEWSEVIDRERTGHVAAVMGEWSEVIDRERTGHASPEVRDGT